MKSGLLIVILFTSLLSRSQESYTIETRDIDRFWKAYDLLQEAKSYDDSVQAIQTHYLDQASPYFQEFIRLRKFSAGEYVNLIRSYPKFWKSVRTPTERIVEQKAAIAKLFEVYHQRLPHFKQPALCFAIGCLRTGGTTSKKLILIGAEISASDQSVDKSEMSGWLERIIGSSNNVVDMIAHETVHTQQFNKRKYNLLIGVMTEGIADFFTIEFFGFHINRAVFDYGEAHQCELYQAFRKDLEEHPKDYMRWLYQGNSSKDKPADLGYYIGYQIAKSYYDQAEDKEKALQDLLNVKRYQKIYRKSGFAKMNCEKEIEE